MSPRLPRLIGPGLCLAGAFGLAVTGGAVADDLGPGVTAGSPISADFALTLDDPRVLEKAIEQDLVFRAHSGMASDRTRVEWLYAHPDATVRNRSAGALLTPAEWQELAVRNELEVDANVIDSYYGTHPDRTDDFGGIRLAHDTAVGKLVVYMRTGADMPWLAGIRHPERLELRHAEASYRALKARSDELQGDDVTAELAAMTGLRLDLDRGVVVVGFEPADTAGLADGELPPNFARRYGTALLRSEPMERARDVATTDLAAGWKMRVWNAAHTSQVDGCTLGFSVTKTGSTSDWMLTAGHCIDDNVDPDHTGDPVYRQGIQIGNYGDHRFWHGGSADAGLVELVGGFNATPRVKVDTVLYDVSNIVPDNHVGAYRCMTGWASVPQTFCDYVTNADTYSDYVKGSVTTRINHMVRVGQHADFGDSGGPWYWNNTSSGVVKAAGIQGSIGSHCGSAPFNCTYSMFTPVDRIPTAFNVDILFMTGGGGGCPPACPASEDGD